MGDVGRTCARVAKRPATPSGPASGPRGGGPRWWPGTPGGGTAASLTQGKAGGSCFLTSSRPAEA